MHCIEKAEKYNVLFKETLKILRILSLNHRPVKFSEDFQSEHELSKNALIEKLCVLNAMFEYFK